MAAPALEMCESWSEIHGLRELVTEVSFVIAFVPYDAPKYPGKWQNLRLTWPREKMQGTIST